MVEPTHYTENNIGSLPTIQIRQSKRVGDSIIEDVTVSVSAYNQQELHESFKLAYKKLLEVCTDGSATVKHD